MCRGSFNVTYPNPGVQWLTETARKTEEGAHVLIYAVKRQTPCMEVQVNPDSGPDRTGADTVDLGLRGVPVDFYSFTEGVAVQGPGFVIVSKAADVGAPFPRDVSG